MPRTLHFALETHFRQDLGNNCLCILQRSVGQWVLIGNIQAIATTKQHHYIDSVASHPDGAQNFAEIDTAVSLDI
ncbi:hypothetical protein [Calothrix sp. 336/3]|uniref:hypothetical protein n=1 Tax=Calothrix sp. 336/3 TaxID=1337936 RepID=UPI0011876D12|nr:hypothetical protein [Calothrix sp. 336/3]